MLALFVAAVTAQAGGTASPPPPAPPAVDFGTLDARADIQPIGRDGKDHPVRARLLAEDDVVEPGGKVRVGLYLTQQDGWHTYWTSPGEIGLPTSIDWSVPAKWGVGDHAYPAPQRFEAEELVSFGYDDQVLLIAEMDVPQDAEPGEYQVAAKAEWLVCKTSCIPGSAELTLPVEIGEAEKPADWSPLFEHFADQHPVSPESVGLTTELVLSADAVRPYEPFQAVLRLSGPGRLEPDLERFAFAPVVGDGWMINAQSVGHVGDDIVVKLEGETLLDAPPETDRIGGLFQVLLDGEPTAVLFETDLPWKPEGAEVVASEHALLTATPTPFPGAAHDPPADPEPHSDDQDVEPVLASANAGAAGSSDIGFFGNLIAAFLGGLLLNVMPCVLPVLTLKLYSLVEQTDITPREQKTAGLAYTAGILVSFLALAVTVLVARSAMGSSVGWGFQFQYPPYVAGLATVVFAFSLSLFGVFELPAMGTSTASEAGMKEGPVGYFFTGVFATLLATPCSAPILGTATAFTLSASAPELVAIYSLIGLGLAAPFLLIAFVPALYRLLPRPGAWMETFKQLLGFTLVATALWLVGVLGTQIGTDRLVGFLAFLGFVSLGCWIYGHFGGLAETMKRQLAAGTAGLLVTGIGGALYLDLDFAEPECDDTPTETAAALDFSHHIPWQPFSEKRVEELKGNTVFVDFTAEWCLTCKINEKTVLETASVRDAMAAHGVVPLKADWTRQDATITEWLNRYGKAGVPFYLVLPADGEPIPLGEIITPGTVTEALKKASGS